MDVMSTTNNSSTSTASGNGIGCGLVNLGNTCYANAALQALAHAPELHSCLHLIHSANDIDKQDIANKQDPDSNKIEIRPTCSHRKLEEGSGDKEDKNICVLCCTESLLWKLMTSVSSNTTSKSIAPNELLDVCLPHFAPEGTFRRGVQEDSHEFLRLLIDGMQNSVISTSETNENKDHNIFDLSQYPYQLFHGLVSSKVKCSNCSNESSTLDPMEDLTLMMNSQITSIVAALEDAYKKDEVLEGYTCEKCHHLSNSDVPIIKSSKLSQVPPVLTLHLKRFRYGSSTMPSSSKYTGSVHSSTGKSGSSKIEGHIKFEEVLSLGPYMDPLSSQKAMLCRLFGVVVHTGKSAHSGHYFAYVKSVDKNEWWKMDDSNVSPVSKEEVLASEAYMLFYNVIHHPLTSQLKDLQKSSGDIARRLITSDSKIPEKSRNQSKKRDFTVEEWVKDKKLRLSSESQEKVERSSDWMIEKVGWVPSFFRKLDQQSKKSKDKLSPCKLVGDVKENDVEGNFKALRETLSSYWLNIFAQESKNGSIFPSNKDKIEKGQEENVVKSQVTTSL